ncbi:hypothetical protein BB559_001499 [Furculomyces boomerangus]|uniref:SAM-dependent MTase RsmB/NOP-type domain-containing protein n=1 Tax=Furculomyces boomerangus TaxID=61424 RepID=A0A2T9Z1R1_9FUNG|nr:hypothetical protein BB559_001499 [Furculomyces boomerangus]
MGFYSQTSSILSNLLYGKASLKSATIGNSKIKPEHKRRVYAAICETLKYSRVLLQVLDNTKILIGEKKILDIDCLVALHDLFFARGGIQHDKQDLNIKKLLLKNKNILIKEFERYKTLNNVKSKTDMQLEGNDKVFIPRYIRVNTLKASVDNVIERFVAEGYKYLDTVLYNEFEKKLRSKKSFCRDMDIPNVLVFPPSTDFHVHEMYKSGEIIFQDKASCFPAYILNPEPGSTIIDACAAPGNKTSHLASIIDNQGLIYACDLDKVRLNVLIKQTGIAGCTCIEPKCTSFLDFDPNSVEGKSIEYILLDPSCSGSGIVNRSDQLVDSFIDTFPNVKKITYSTCSIHTKENESVVENVLSHQNRFKLANRSIVLSEWNSRGIEYPNQNIDASLTKRELDALVRSSPEEMHTNGFFVACFVDPALIYQNEKDNIVYNEKRPLIDFVKSPIATTESQKVEVLPATNDNASSVETSFLVPAKTNGGEIDETKPLKKQKMDESVFNKKIESNGNSTDNASTKTNKKRKSGKKKVRQPITN